MPKILLIEDETNLADALAYSLRREGFDIRTSADGTHGLASFHDFQPDLVLLDLMLPGKTGLDVCRELRRTSDVPVLMLTAKAAEFDRVIGFAVGADDYVTKPFSTPELVARIRAILRRNRRSEVGKEETLAYGLLRMDLYRRIFTLRDRPVELTRREFALLELFLRYPGRVFTREDLLSRVWGESEFIDDRTVDVHVRWLRRKIEDDPAHPRLIQTVRGVGYRFGE